MYTRTIDAYAVVEVSQALAVGENLNVEALAGKVAASFLYQGDNTGHSFGCGEACQAGIRTQVLHQLLGANFNGILEHLYLQVTFSTHLLVLCPPVLGLTALATVWARHLTASAHLQLHGGK